MCPALLLTLDLSGVGADVLPSTGLLPKPETKIDQQRVRTPQHMTERGPAERQHRTKLTLVLAGAGLCCCDSPCVVNKSRSERGPVVHCRKCNTSVSSNASSEKGYYSFRVKQQCMVLTLFVP